MIAKLLYANPRYLALMLLVIVAVGASSISSLGRQEDPTITPFIAKIETFFPGASPTRVESLVTKPLEDALREIPEVDEIESTSASGVSIIHWLSSEDPQQVPAVPGRQAGRLCAPHRSHGARHYCPLCQ